MVKPLFGLLLLFYFAVLFASQGSNFIAANQAYRSANVSLVTAYARQLQNHVLISHVEYYQLRMQLARDNLVAIEAFLSRYQGSFIADKLRREWLKVLGEQQQWELFAKEYSELPDDGGTELACYSLQQRLLVNDKTALEDARPLWFTKYDMPNSCTPVFDALVISGQILTKDIWVRIRLTLGAGQTGVAKHINRYLPDSQAFSVSSLDAAIADPLGYLAQTKIKTRADREITLFAMLLLLRSDTNRAVASWSKIDSQLPEFDQAYFYRELAFKAALRHDVRALDWFLHAAKINSFIPLRNDQLAWKARAALRALNWKILLDSIEEMPISMQQADSWRYWRARALESTGKITEASAIFVALSAKHSFYGQLAREELGVMLSIPPKSYQAGKKDILNIEQIPGIQRALTLFRLNFRTHAVGEWNWVIREFDDTQLLAAAEVARKRGIYDRAINTASKTVERHNFNLRFLAPYRQQLRLILQQYALDEAWVYGLIRQESRFIANINSHAGAMGLMQIMPATAKWVASKLGMNNYRKIMAVEIETNLKLGTYYLKHVLTSFNGQALLAVTAYNAGPGRAHKWRGTRLLEGAIYVETIPFRETRNYVKKVMNNSMYYARILNHKGDAPTLKQRLGVVYPK